MTEEEKLQALLRVKRHEAPREGFHDDFLKNFQDRQRRDLIDRSVASIMVERLQLWWSSLQRPAVIWTAAAAYACIMLGVHLWPRPTHAPDTTIVVNQATQPTNGNILPAVGQPRPVNVSTNEKPLREIPTWKERTEDPKNKKPAPVPPEPVRPKLREL